MHILYHITERSTWQAYLETGHYESRVYARSGFILCATADHYVAIANALFAGKQDLMLLFIDASRLQAKVTKAEVNRHPVLRLYAPPPIEAIFEVAEFGLNPEGKFDPQLEVSALTIHGENSLADTQARAVRAMAGFERPWWVAGGWAIDLFLGKKTRPHADLELSVLRADQAALYQHLQNWDLRIAGSGQLLPWDGQPLSKSQHQIWARQGSEPAVTPAEFSADPTMIDFLIEEHADTTWHYRRFASLTRPLNEFGTKRDGISIVRPEIALLYKAKSSRYKDQRDFDELLPALDEPARQWLRQALQTAHPDHPWCAAV